MTARLAKPPRITLFCCQKPGKHKTDVLPSLCYSARSLFAIQAAVPHVFSEKETVLYFGTSASFSLTRQTLSSDEDSFCHPSCYLSLQDLLETEQLCALKNRSIRYKFWQGLAPQAVSGSAGSQKALLTLMCGGSRALCLHPEQCTHY